MRRTTITITLAFEHDDEDGDDVLAARADDLLDDGEVQRLFLDELGLEPVEATSIFAEAKCTAQALPVDLEQLVSNSPTDGEKEGEKIHPRLKDLVDCANNSVDGLDDFSPYRDEHGHAQFRLADGRWFGVFIGAEAVELSHLVCDACNAEIATEGALATVDGGVLCEACLPESAKEGV